jgi:hypothetical protein
MKVERPDSRAGFRWSVGRACGSFRLQKSTSGAWPCAPGRDERTEAAGSSSSSLGSAGRKSVGSRVGAAKSRDRWRVRVRGLFRASGVGRAGTRRWKMPWVVGAVAFERSGGEGGPGGACRASAHARRDTGVKGRHVRPVRGRQRRGQGVPPVGSTRSGARQDWVASAPAGSAGA